jgi:UDP-N-acetyl-D-glucosamine dehydrogenase
VRESPAIDIIHLLGKRGAKVTYSDPFVPQLRADGVLPHDLHAIDAEQAVAAADCVVIVTDHHAFDCARIVDCARRIVDTRNELKGISSEKIARL